MRKKRRIPLIFFFYGELQLQETGAGKKHRPMRGGVLKI
jgi:hypothetical protein